MKTLIFLLISIFFMHSISESQITEEYPFKTYLDSSNNLYTAGYLENNGQRDIYVQKYSGQNQLWDRLFSNPFGDDRGLDLAVDKNGYVFITGYTYNTITNSNDIIVASLNPGGAIRWSKILNNPGDDKGMGIDITYAQNGNADEVFISGYITSTTSGKNFIIKKYSADNGDSIWQRVTTEYPNDDIATDILLDAGYAYVMGYSYQGAQRLNDMMLQVFEKTDGILHETLFDHRRGSSEMPTGFILAEKSDNQVQKSRIAVTSVSDNTGIIGTSRSQEFLTLFLEPTEQNQFSIAWERNYSRCFTCKTDVATSIAKDDAGDIYVAGYVFNYNNPFQSNGLDFATIKYKKDNGKYGWSDKVKFFNLNDTSTIGVNDKASSVKVNHRKEVFVAGPSEASPYGFAIVSYEQLSNVPKKKYHSTFTPNFMFDGNSGLRNLNKWATLHLANDGTPLMVVMGWNESGAYWSAIRYDSEGNVLYIINNDGDKTSNEGSQTDKSVQTGEEYEMTLTNYPNPFNPSTMINYTVPSNSTGQMTNVKIIVYNSLGKEISKLVDENKQAGRYSVDFHGSDLSSGMYYYSMILNGKPEGSRRMILIK